MVPLDGNINTEKERKQGDMGAEDGVAPSDAQALTSRFPSSFAVLTEVATLFCGGSFPLEMLCTPDR